MLGLTSKLMIAQRRYAILFFFVMAALITPPDIVSQFVIAIPALLLYELAILGVKSFERKKPR